MLCTLQEALSRLDYLCNRLLNVRLSHVELQPGCSSVGRRGYPHPPTT
jgi:hypothetical protein